MIGNIIKRNQRGLTLVELLIVLTVFSLTAFLAMSILLMYLGAQEKILVKQGLENDLRSIMESVVYDVHETSIDYTHYLDAGLDLEEAVTDLALISERGERVLYRADEVEPGKYVLLKDGHNLDSNKLTLEKISFYIHPAVTPWEKQLLAGAYVYENTQPYVTIFMRGVTVNTKGEREQVDLQTTVTLRYYAR